MYIIESNQMITFADLSNPYAVYRIVMCSYYYVDTLNLSIEYTN